MHSLAPLRRTAALLALPILLLSGCASETLFRSNFNPTAVGQPPAPQQDIGTVAVDGSGGVVVINAPVAPSPKWVQLTRMDGPQAAIPAMQGNFVKFRGDGEYTFAATMFLPAGQRNVATIQFESFGQPISSLNSFLHIDFMPNNTVRIDDTDSTAFGSFPRDAPFIVQVTLHIAASGSSAHIVLAGANASGIADRNITPALNSMARQFGAIRLWMGFPWSGSFDATNISVTRRTD
jgi:hypothetical protein